MTKPRLNKRTLTQIGIALAATAGLLVGCLSLDLIPMSAAKPPPKLKTLQDFRAWKRGSVMGMRTFTNSGKAYTVMLAPAGRFLASGPSAYLFDKDGRFIDWTADMGDLPTVYNRWDLTSGHVKGIGDETNHPVVR